MLVLEVIDISGEMDHDITAVEWDEELARLYQERFPNDKVIVGDATPVFIRPLQRI